MYFVSHNNAFIANYMSLNRYLNRYKYIHIYFFLFFYFLFENQKIKVFNAHKKIRGRAVGNLWSAAFLYFVALTVALLYRRSLVRTGIDLSVWVTVTYSGTHVIAFICTTRLNTKPLNAMRDVLICINLFSGTMCAYACTNIMFVSLTQSREDTKLNTQISLI